MQKHNSRNNDEGYLIKFATEFFKELDKNNTGKLSGNCLLESLISLGIATDSYVLAETLSMIFQCNDINNLQITEQDFLSIFRFEVINDLILEQLNENSISERKKQKALSTRHIRLKSADSGNKATNLFKARLALSLAGHDLSEIERNSQKMITINEHLAIIENLWNKFYTNGEDGANVLTICEIFKFFKIFQDNFECKKYIYSILGQVQNLSYREFQQLFAKSMIKGAFVNLSKRLFEGNYAEKEMSSGFKISAYQRALLMSGVKCPNSNISIEEGQRIVAAVEKLQCVPKMTFEELRKEVLDFQGESEAKADKNVIRIRKDRKMINDLKNISKKFFNNNQKNGSFVSKLRRKSTLRNKTVITIENL